jgi:hypothetical protein
MNSSTHLPWRALAVLLCALSIAAGPAAGGALEAQDLEYQRLNVVLDELPELEQPLDHGAPVPQDSIGIGPGSTLIVNFFDPVEDATFTGICTAAFVMRDRTTGNVYLSAAGHCFIGATFASTHGADADWDPANTLRVRVCVQDCLGGATGLVSAAEGIYPGTTRDIGVGDIKLDYARQTIAGADVGNDFGIVEIPEELWCEIRTDMPVWNGPATADTSRLVQAGDVLVHYGNGVVVGEVFPEKSRAGLGMAADSDRWLANLAAAPGDSGSAMNIATVTLEDLVEGEWPGGVLTHLVIDTEGGVVAGTNTSRGIQMALEDAGFDLEVVHDAAELCGGGEPVVTTVDDADPAVEYRKGWHRRDDAAASGSGYHRRMGGAGGGDSPTARLVFDGSEITYFFAASEQGGTADVFLDGALAATVSYAGTAPGSSPEPGRSITFGDLGEGTHEIVIAHRGGAVYVDGFEIVSRAGGGADASAAGTGSVTTTSTGQLSGLGTTLLTRTVEVGPDDEWLSVVVEGASKLPTVNVLDPTGVLVATGGRLLDGSSAAGIDRAPAVAGTYTVQVLDVLGSPSAVGISVSRTVRRE